MVDFDHASAHTVPVGGNADDRDVLTRTRRVAVAVLVCSIALSACSPSGPESVSPPTAASPVNSLPVTPSPTLALATPSPLPGGAITTYAGRDFSGDGGPATAARLLAPAGVALDPAGNLYIADTADHRIRKVTPGGTISTYAGSGNFGFSGDGGPATAAELNFPRDVALDPAGNLYIADSGNSRIRKVSPGGTISTYAGSGSRGFSGDGGPAAAAQLNNPVGMALDPAGNLYIADITNNRIRKVTSGGTISTYAGSGSFGFSGDGGPATDAQLSVPVGVALDPAGNLYIADHDNGRIRKVTSGGTISTYAGSGSRGLSGDGGPATAAQLYSPHGVALDTAGNLYIADSNRIRKVTPGGTISTYAGTGTGPFSGDGGPATAAQLSSPAGVALDLTGNLYIADDGNYRIRKVTPGGTISTYAGGGSSNFSGDGGPATAAQLNVPVGVALDPAGNLYIADQGNSRIRKVTPGGTISTYAGTDTPGFSGDGGPATAAQLNVPVGVAVDPAGNLYIADSGSSRIRKVGPGGTISTYAGGGGGTPGFLGDGGPATAAYLNNPVGVTLDPAGNLYIADTYNNRIRKVTPTVAVSTTPAPTASASLAAAPPPNIRTTPLGQVTGNWLFYGVQIPRPERDRIEIQIIAVPASGGAATIVVAFDAATARGGANGVFTVGIFDSAPYLRRQFSPDGRRMVFSIGGELVVIDLVTGQAKPLGVRGFYPSWSRDGSQIAFVFEKPVADAGANRSHAIGVVPVAGGSPRELVASSQDTSVEWSPDGSRILSPIPVVDCVDCPPVHATMEVTTGRIGMRFAFVSGGPSYSHWRTGSPELAIAIEVCGEIATPVSRIVGIDERTRSERILVDVAEPCPERDGRLEAVQLRDPRWNPAVADELLYVMARGNDFETHVVNIATGKDTRLPISAYEATWTRDGSAVAYLVKDPGSSFGSAVRVWKRDGSGETEIRRATGGEAVFSIASVSY